MQVITNNPYRIVGLLAGATAREQERQVRRIKQFIEAEQDPEDDFSFPLISKLDRTVHSIVEATSKLNLDNDKMNAALFWFWNGNPIVDEAAFDALKDGDIETAYQIWDRLTTQTSEDGKRVWKNVTEKNHSAFHNSSVLSLMTNKGNFVSAVMANIKFIESEHFIKFVKDTVDETYKISKKDIESTFLQTVLEAADNRKLADLVKYLHGYDFAAKTDFHKSFIQKPIEQIEQKIESVKNRRRSNKADAIKAGQELVISTANSLAQLKSVNGSNDIRYTSIADKVANEILQCSIDYFNDSQEKGIDGDYPDIALKLARQAETIAAGNLARDRIKDNVGTMLEMKDRELSEAVVLLKSIKDSYEKNEAEIRQHVKKLEETDLEIRLGYKSINHKTVEDNIKNSINWQKVDELLITILSDDGLKKIKRSDNTEQKNEFLELIDWLKENSSKKSLVNSIIIKYKKIPPKLPFKIISSTITHTDDKPLYTKFVRYIGLNIKVEVTEEKPVTYFIKYIAPNGTIKRNSTSSPKGYTLSDTRNLNARTRSINTPSWGNPDKCAFDVGQHRIEVYVDEYLIHTNNFSVEIAPSDVLANELKEAEHKLLKMKNAEYFKSEFNTLNAQMNKIKEWKFLRSQSDKNHQIKEQQDKINALIKRADEERRLLLTRQQSVINEIKIKIQHAEY